MRNDYLAEENRILRDQIKGRLRLSDAERRNLAEIGQRLGRKALEEVAQIVRPETILAAGKFAGAYKKAQWAHLFRENSLEKARHSPAPGEFLITPPSGAE